MEVKCQQKVVGLFGGTSWPSTILYYEKLNKLVNQKLKGFHSARILLYNIDYHEIKSSYGNNWGNIGKLLGEEIQFLLAKKPDCLVICNNTLHKVFDELNLNLEIPVFHAGILSANYAIKNGYKTVLLLGTKFTMEDGFFAKYFANLGVIAIVPNKSDIFLIQEMQTQISSGVKNDVFFKTFGQIIGKYQNICDAICLACTELPLYVNSQNCNLPIINPIDLQCVEAVNFTT